MDRTELFLAIIAYTLIVQVFIESGSEMSFALLPLFVLLFAIPAYVVIALVWNPQLE